MPILNQTSNFKFSHIDGDDPGGFNSINAIITNIDTRLYERAIMQNMIVAYQGAAPPTGWALVSATPMPTLPSGHIWIRKT